MPFFAFDSYNLITTGIVILAVQIIFFIFASAFKTDKVTDLSYSMTFVIMALILLFTGGNYALPRVLIALCITVWGFRLGGYLFSRILRLKKDDRFNGIRENALSFAGFWFLQACTIWIVLLPSTIVLSMHAPLPVSVFTWTGTAVWIIGFIIETIADQQKYTFRNDPSHKGKWIDRGLWSVSRHPNYFGETLCWWGLFLIAVPYLEGMMMLSIAGPIFITFMLLFVSGVPTVEKKAEEKYGHDPEFRAYKNRTSIFFPLPPKRKKSTD